MSADANCNALDNFRVADDSFRVQQLNLDALSKRSGQKSHDARNCARSLRLADGPDVCYRENQEALKRYRLMPSFLILDSSVCRGIPSLTAAPVCPPNTPSDSRSSDSSNYPSRSSTLATNVTD